MGVATTRTGRLTSQLQLECSRTFTLPMPGSVDSCGLLQGCQLQPVVRLWPPCLPMCVQQVHVNVVYPLAHALMRQPFGCMQLAAQNHNWLLLQDEFPETYRFTASIFPSEDDDVVTSPYNAMLSLAELTQHADAVLPLENQALLDICSLLDSKLKPTVKPGSLATGPEAGGVHSEPLR